MYHIILSPFHLQDIPGCVGRDTLPQFSHMPEDVVFGKEVP